ncbi:MAG: DUF3050 domain-containing protein [Myxococcota bacterium]|jgi:hypothetical protein|nr:DUF3050 domain-containing protein [Myxococcota bacterium]
MNKPITDELHNVLRQLDWPPELSARMRYLYTRCATHSVFGQLHEIESLHLFMEHHIWAVWDFMCLTKSVQQVLCSQKSPWQPAQHPDLARTMHEIMQEEESGQWHDGRYLSHFEWYLEAMREAGANTTQIEGFMHHLENKGDAYEGLERFAPPAAAKFVKQTLMLCAGSPATRIAAFALGREKLIPDMFPKLLEHSRFGGLRYYLEQHIEIDGDAHGPFALQMLERYARKDTQASWGALQALKARVGLWDEILGLVDASRAGRHQRALAS